jgi:hypothetical protein
MENNTLTVRQLIEILQQYDGDLPIAAWWDSMRFPVRRAERLGDAVVLAVHDYYDGDWFGALSDQFERDASRLTPEQLAEYKAVE